ncbi:DUF4832 domain-containing protein [Paenibacillus daejeonensis]|uniref:DUF4832 domain-containing protein n=1 Tax=Paenibacillus daejeonensis TaxID=135193 RepID=UPI000369644F|nr:DUF4832 domain-containing protein [Paenibacillus daejeonensis]
MSKTITVYPDVHERVIENPGIGFTAAPQLMGAPERICDNLGVEHAKYKFSPDSATYNHPDAKVSFIGVRWKDIEPVRHSYRWELIDERLASARALGYSVIIRCSPYALQLDDDIPAWFREAYPERPAFPFWRVDPNTTPYADYWSEFISAFAARYDGHPLLSSVDLAIVGAWGEGGGTEFMDVEAISRIIDAYVDGFKQTPLQALLHDPVSVGLLTDRRARVGFRVDCLGDMGGFHGERWSHMTDFYPQNIQNFRMAEAWKQGPVVFEACWHMNDWYVQGWDIDYIIAESLRWHISSFNNKGTVVPEPWREKVEGWLRQMGYRFELRTFSYSPEVRPGGCLEVSGLWANVGVAPLYNRYPLTIRLVGVSQTYTFTCQEDPRSWLPDEDIWWEEWLSLPDDLAEGIYQLELGIVTGIEEIGNVKLAIEGEKDGYYPLGTIRMGGVQADG